MHGRLLPTRLAHWGARLLLLGLAGCVEAYLPEVVSNSASFLVVDGFINGNGATRIHLSRTENLAATSTPPAERGAKLFVVDDLGGRYALAERSAGFYQSDSLLLSPARQYQLRITTGGARAANYESDLVPLKVTPPIDQLGWTLDSTHVQLALSTHDPSGQSRYYRWNFVETWEFNSAFKSVLQFDYITRKVVPRTVPIYTCWRTERSSLIKQSSTAQLSQDALSQVPLLQLSTHAERLAVRYSVLLTQVAETPAEFAYYEQLRKNTEAVGTVNDPLPTQLVGNVHRVGSSEVVLGYVGAHTQQQQRLFINRAELPFSRTWKFYTVYMYCEEGTDLADDIFSDPGSVPVSYVPGGKTYTGSTRECVDCTLRGSNVKPSFW